MLTTEARQKILAQNDAAAAELRGRFARAGTLVVDLISSPGSGKTSLLEATARRLSKTLRLGCVVGDVATERDAERLRAAGLPSRQIVTGGSCHLEARIVRDALDAARFGELDVLFVENVGNLVCPASFALGEDFKIVLLSTTEGDDKPFKYPGIFSKAAVAVITKCDLLPHVRFDVERAESEIRTLRPDVRIVRTSTADGRGLDAWCDLLSSSLAEKRAARANA
ncbi:MAG: hydrogenase nickel incorporation protein HypB [Planctomycetes bacterium]|nr:hydrogenase nickel incorporation protein HypB [Planctomycetota bacterium]